MKEQEREDQAERIAQLEGENSHTRPLFPWRRIRNEHRKVPAAWQRQAASSNRKGLVITDGKRILQGTGLRKNTRDDCCAQVRRWARNVHALCSRAHYAEVEEQLEQTAEAVRIHAVTSPPFGGIRDLRPLPGRRSTWALSSRWRPVDIRSTLYAMRSVKEFFKGLEIEAPTLKEWRMASRFRPARTASRKYARRAWQSAR